jgi:hypothetical protein
MRLIPRICSEPPFRRSTTLRVAVCLAASRPSHLCLGVRTVRRDLVSRRKDTRPHPSGLRRCHARVAIYASLRLFWQLLRWQPSSLGAPAPSPSAGVPLHLARIQPDRATFSTSTGRASAKPLSRPLLFLHDSGVRVVMNVDRFPAAVLFVPGSF